MDPETREEIMGATYRALREHGYADVTMQAIADESAKSKAALHYHYDTKRELLLAFHDHLFESFVERLDDAEAAADADDPASRLTSIFERLLSAEDDDAHTEFHALVLETKARGPYDEAVRRKHLRIDDHVRARFETILRDGIEEGTFDEAVDPEETAAFLWTLINGCHTRKVATGRGVEPVRRQLYEFARTTLVADGGAHAAEVLPE
ncbi:TetR/AcrR family transcriptional regulator [Halobium palmae]|uniref:TetR/AcrR family transcriptional regulator n=1 Tax=Halobium palmae TaxID=1776492 RepID=A0ABD5RXP1_9EURY